MNITFVGDAHGKWETMLKIADRHCIHNRVIQVGDLGIGFGEDRKHFFPNFFFIHGNHDNPRKCESDYSSHFLGRFGYLKHLGLFFVSGAWSIDANQRIPFRDWWPDEELSAFECQQVMEMWTTIKPDYIVTHDAPDDVANLLLSGFHRYPTRTGQLFNQMFAAHQPKIWIFGHYHKSLDAEINGTRFICLAELEEKTIDLCQLSQPEPSKDQVSPKSIIIPAE